MEKKINFKILISVFIKNNTHNLKYQSFLMETTAIYPSVLFPRDNYLQAFVLFLMVLTSVFLDNVLILLLYFLKLI